MTPKDKANIEAICEEILDHDWMYEEYSSYIMEHCGGDRMICNGDALILAVEDQYLLDDFADEVLSKIEAGLIVAPKTLVLQ